MGWDHQGGLKGPQGDQGPTGLQGLTGAKGDKGDKGDQGDTGPAGTTTWAGITGKPAVIAAGADATAARSAIGLGSAAVAPILGTVSQSAGVPTGAVMQSGSNANGNWLRLADGTQLCWTSPKNSTWTFPAGFSVAPTVVTGNSTGFPQAADSPGNASPVSATTATLFGAIPSYLFAIGRWF